MSTTQELERALGHDVYDVDGQKVGTASHLYASDVSGAPEWVTVKTGLFGSKESFVPLTGAHAEQDGLHVGAHKDLIKDAPRIDDNGHLSESEAGELYRHYNLRVGAPGMTGQPGADGQPGMSGKPGMDGQSGMSGQPGMSGKPGMDVQGGKPGKGKGKDARQGMGGQESMVRSEEQLRAGTETVETGRVRLQKHVVTEEQQIAVPVSHEEVHVVREPMKAGDVGSGKIGEDEREVVLHEDRPVVAKETVAVERVGLETETIREEQQVKETVRKEQIDVEDTTKNRKH